MQNLSVGVLLHFFKSVSMLCGAEEACPAHNRKVGGSKPPKANSGFSSVGRAFDCSGIQTSNSRWFDSGKPEITTFPTLCGKSGTKSIGILLHFSYEVVKSVFGRIVK